MLITVGVNGPPTIKISDYLPRVYGHLLPEIFTRSIPIERKATCDDCAMCDSGTSAADAEALGLKYFNPDTKCCTFHPSLPNYLVGAILSSTDPAMEEGRRRIRDKIRQGTGVVPRGIVMPPKYSLLYDHSTGTFGRSPEMLCPYYDGGNCSIWKFREAVCSTYFCRYVKGDRGKTFWEELKRYLTLLEHRLSLYCALEAFPDREHACRVWDQWDKRTTLSREDVEGRPPAEREREELWKEWTGEEERFYRECHDRVLRLTPERLRAVLGVEEGFLHHKLDEAHHRAYTAALPKRLRRNPALKVARRNGEYVCTVSGMQEAFELSSILYPLLDEFDGTSDSDAVCAQLEKTRKVLIPPAVLGQLYDVGVLVEA